MKAKYTTHLKDKWLCTNEEGKHKKLVAINKHIIDAVYNLQAVLPAPRRDTSLFYYKSKINSYNCTTISQLNLVMYNPFSGTRVNEFSARGLSWKNVYINT